MRVPHLAALTWLAYASAADGQCPDGSPTVNGICGRRPVPEKSVAVLPFRNLGPDAAQQYFADGIADAILNELARLPGVKVTARASSFAFRGRDLDVRAVAESLGVAKIVEGSVLKSGNRIRVQASLIDAKTRFVLWSGVVDKIEADIFELQDTVSRAIANRLGAAPGTGQPLVRRATESSRALDHYLRGRDLLYRRDSASIAAAITEFERAIQADRRYAPAYAALSSALGLRIVIHAWPKTSIDVDSSYAWAARSLAAANQALALDSLLPEAHAARGYLKLYIAPPSAGAEQDFVRALALKPGYAEATGWLAQHFSLAGRPIEALETVMRAVELDPVSVGMQLAVVGTTFNNGDHHRAFEHARALRVLRPQLIGFTAETEGLSLMMLGRAQECLQLPRLHSALDAVCLLAAGRAEDAVPRLFSAMDEWNQRRGDPTYRIVNIITFLARTEQVDRAITWARLLWERSPVTMLGWGHSRMLDPGLSAEGGRLRIALTELRQTAWDRILRESQRVVLP